jgi:hypothetical protein
MGIRDFISDYEKNPTIDKASKLGKMLLHSEISIEKKQDYFSELFKITTSNKIEALFNMWTVGVMLEDELPIPQIVSAVGGFIKDPSMEIE